MNRKAVVILGMHRSGTSTASGMFHHAGFDLGRSVTGGNPANPKGFFENYRVLFFHDDLFRFLGTDWHHTAVLQEGWWLREDLVPFEERLKSLISEDYGNGTGLLFKDPRLCILLPLYLKVFRETGIDPVFVVMYRDPREVIQSLIRRDSFPEAKSAVLWTDHMLRAEFYTRDYARTFLNYRDVLADPVAVMQAALQKLLPQFIPDEGLAPRLMEFVEPVLNHFEGENADLQFANPLCLEVSDTLLRAVERNSTGDETRELDRLRSRFYGKFSIQNIPGVTVITPCPGCGGDITASVKSLAGQDYPRLTHLILDNCIPGVEVPFPEGMRYLVGGVIPLQGLEYIRTIRSGIGQAAGDWVALLEPGEVFSGSDAVARLMELADQADVLATEDEAGKSRFLLFRKSFAETCLATVNGGVDNLQVLYGLFRQCNARINTTSHKTFFEA